MRLTKNAAKLRQGFTYRRTQRVGRSLYCEDISVEKLANKFGTPLYIYSDFSITDRFEAFDSSFNKIPHTICYSVKANSNASLLRMLAELGSGFDIVSGGELERVKTIKPDMASKVVFSGVGKTSEEIDAALLADILLFNVESESELEQLAARASKLHRVARVALRINPNISADTHPYISTGLNEHKFGIAISEARRLYKLAGKHSSLDVAGVSVHIGSQIVKIKPFSDAMQCVRDLVRQLKSDGHSIRYVDAGGGVAIDYKSRVRRSFRQRLSEYAAAVIKPLMPLRIHLLLEPGRALIGPAGVLIAKVLYLKHNGKKRFIVLDAAMNDLIRPALYGAYHEIVPVSRVASRQKKVVDIVGPICETGDFFARDREMAPVEEGDFVAILDVGAYGMSLSSNYNSRPRPAEALVRGDSVRLIRRREKIMDLMIAET